MMITQSQIDTFFEKPTLAIVGASRKPGKFGFQVLKALAAKNRYRLFPVNPHADEILGIKCYQSITGLPEEVNAAVLLTPKKNTAEAVRQCIEKGIKNIWIQQMSQTPESLKIAGESGANVIYGKCIMMFAEPVGGIHRFHRAVYKFFGKLPK